MDPGKFMNWKQEVNKIASFHKAESLSEPSNKGALAPDYSILSGKIEPFVGVVADMKAEIERTLGCPEP